MAASRETQLFRVDEVLADNNLLGWLSDCPDDTDTRNSRISLAALCVLRSCGGVFAALNVQSSSVLDPLQLRPPCRWEKRSVTLYVPRRAGNIWSSLGNSACDEHRLEVQVECVMDVGHNPAAIAALVRRIQREYLSTPYRYCRVNFVTC